jgi:hypothetical protein
MAVLNGCKKEYSSEIKKSKELNVNMKITFITDRAWKRIHYLSITYLSFIRPSLEYADVVYLNCTQYKTFESDKIQNEALVLCAVV